MKNVLFMLVVVAAIVSGGFFFFRTPAARCPLLPDPSGKLIEVCPIGELHAPIGMPLTPEQMGEGGPGVVAGIRVTRQFPSWIFSHDSSATTTPVLTVTPDDTIDPETMRIISVESPVLIQKPDGVHVEYIYNSGIVAPEDAADITEPRLVPGGVVFRDQLGTARVYALGDGGVIAGLPTSKALAFVASSTRYLADAHGVYFFNYKQRGLAETATDAVAHMVKGADPHTFTVLYAEADFAKDATHFFLNGETVSDMTPQGMRPFPHRNDPYYSGVDTRYYDDTWLYTISFATEEGNPYIARQYDRGIIAKELLKNIYYQKVRDVNSQQDQFTRYMITSDGVSYNGTKIPGADDSRFELIVGLSGPPGGKSGVAYEYARDGASVYVGGKRILNADRDTFLPLPLNSAYATDKTRVYLGGQVIAGADPATFEALWFPVYEGCALGMYARDAHHVYYKDKAVDGADPLSFKALLDGYGRDVRGVYLHGVFRADIDPGSFTEPSCNYG